MKTTRIWFIFFIFSMTSLVIALLNKENHLYYSVGIGVSYCLWNFAYTFSSPFHWRYKIQDASYALWFIGLCTYFLYAELYIPLALFLIPVGIHFHVWGERKDEEALFYLLLEIEKHPNRELIQAFKNEIFKRDYSEFFPFWRESVFKVEQSMEQKNLSDPSKSIKETENK